VIYKLLYTKEAQKDVKKLASSNLKNKANEILKLLENEPLADYPPYEKLIGDLQVLFLEE